jgi:hypothetical protein
MLAERLLKRRTIRLLCAAASAAGLQVFTGGAARGTLSSPDILTCEVIPQEYGPYEVSLDDTNNYPEFYLTWGDGNYTDPQNITFYFYQGVNSTTIGTNCWQVYYSDSLYDFYSSPPYNYHSDDMLPFTSSAENQGCNFFPFDVNGDHLSVFDSSIDYEIGVQAQGDDDSSAVVWFQASYTT